MCFCATFARVASVAQRLQVRPIPSGTALVDWNDVVDTGPGLDQAFVLAYAAEWVLGPVSARHGAPGGAVIELLVVLCVLLVSFRACHPRCGLARFVDGRHGTVKICGNPDGIQGFSWQAKKLKKRGMRKALKFLSLIFLALLKHKMFYFKRIYWGFSPPSTRKIQNYLF